MNGLMGVFEIKQFARGSESILNSIAEATQNGSVSIIGGGDTASSANKMNLYEKITHISTGGGASLELLGGIDLPGVRHLTDRNAIDQ